MFELIGMAVVAWFVWQVVKAALAVAIKRTMENAVNFAARYGVPYERGWGIVNEPKLVKTVRRDLARLSDDFKSLPAWQQYGHTIVAIAKELKGENFEFVQTKNKVKAILSPQIAALEAEGIPIRIDLETILYVKVLADTVSDGTFSSEQAKRIVEYCFDESYELDIDVAWEQLKGGSTSEVARAEAGAVLFGVRDGVTGKGEYFIRLTKEKSPRPTEPDPAL